MCLLKIDLQQPAAIGNDKDSLAETKYESKPLES